MSGDATIKVILLVLLLTLPLSALIARRVPLSSTLKMACAWVLIFGTGLVIAGQRDEIARLFGGARDTLIGEDQTVVGETVRIRMAPDGHFWASVSINGVRKRMLIDSGATITALSAATAKAAGIETSGAFPATIETANGQVSARRARVDRLEIGSIVAHDLSVVVSDAFGTTDVIGMNFLSRLRSWRVERGTLILDPHPSR